VLGIAQDGGYPHIGCQKACCQKAWSGENQTHLRTSLALVDSVSRQWWLFEASPDINAQLHLFDSLTGHSYPFLPAGIFLTHAHIGHYTGLMELGREAMNTRNLPVCAMPGMSRFLKNNGPWSQLVSLNNIVLEPLKNDSIVQLSDNITVRPLLVPHRDEFSETCGFRIENGNKKYLFVPDINKWQLWDRDIIEEVGKVNMAFIDGTFNDSLELPGRNMAEIPHPFIQETLNIFSDNMLRQNICFIHFNHSNTAMWDNAVKKELKRRGVNLAEEGDWY
jgi:pyrroloquinoline quinone biosynthesis protein B